VSKVHRIPNGLPLETATASMLQGLTALCLVKLAYSIQKGDWILVHAAAGGTGRLLVQLGKYFGATVIGTTSTDEKAQEAKKLGADYVIRYDQEKVDVRVHEITNGQGVHAVYDGVGKATFDVSLASLRKRGYMVSFGNASGKVPDVDISRLTKGNVYICRPTLFDYLENENDYHQRKYIAAMPVRLFIFSF
jgi:NADPH2:quinone reductase